VRPALAYRFDSHDRSIAFSGDTAPLEAVAQLARGADILVHETLYVPAVEAYVRDRIAKRVADPFRRLHGAHESGPLACRRGWPHCARSGCQTLVLSHLTPGIDGIADATWRDAAAKQFKGKIVVAHDLMVL